jgi:hypothetical protein
MFHWLLDTSSFPARWYCGNWTPAHGWAHIVASVDLFVAYVAIAVMMFIYGHKKRAVLSMPLKAYLVLSCAFVLTCGISHLWGAIVFWFPAYRLLTTNLWGTALISDVAACSFPFVLRHLLALRTPEEYRRLAEAESAARKRAESLAAQRARAIIDITAMAEKLNQELAVLKTAEEIRQSAGEMRRSALGLANALSLSAQIDKAAL